MDKKTAIGLGGLILGTVLVGGSAVALGLSVMKDNVDDLTLDDFVDDPEVDAIEEAQSIAEFCSALYKKQLTMSAIFLLFLGQPDNAIERRKSS